MGRKQPVIFEIGWNACINCGACVAICPQEAGFISAFDTIALHRPCDIACMLCENICPVTTITHTLAPVPPKRAKSIKRLSGNLLKASLILMLFSNCYFTGPSQDIMLYPGAVPNSKPAENLEKTEKNASGKIFTTQTSQPRMTVFPARKPDGRAIIICPGGGYSGTAGVHEGTQVAKAFNKYGVTAFVLKYRLPDDRYCIDKSMAPLQDAQQAIRFVRENAAKWRIDPHKIGIIGFSAGGHVAASAATHFDFRADSTNTDTTSFRPDFAILLYPVVSFQDSIAHLGSRQSLLGPKPDSALIHFFSNELYVTAKTPPTYLVHAQDDDVVPFSNSVVFYRACQKYGVPTDLLLYPKGGHGFGMNNPKTPDQWIKHLMDWMSTLK